MKPKPLTKEKIVERLVKEYEETVRDLNTVSKEEIKQRVEWLLKEIELTDLEWVVYDDGTQERMSEKERKKILRNLIKKAFEGVSND